MTEKLILMHENTSYFNFFSFFETFRGGGRPPAPPYGPAPDGIYTIVLFANNFMFYLFCRIKNPSSLGRTWQEAARRIPLNLLPL